MKKTYKAIFTETLKRVEMIRAESQEEAMSIAEALYADNSVILTCEDHFDTNIEIEERTDEQS